VIVGTNVFDWGTRDVYSILDTVIKGGRKNILDNTVPHPFVSVCRCCDFVDHSRY
jgi:hypothetical protein